MLNKIALDIVLDKTTIISKRKGWKLEKPVNTASQTIYLPIHSLILNAKKGKAIKNASISIRQKLKQYVMTKELLDQTFHM